MNRICLLLLPLWLAAIAPLASGATRLYLVETLAAEAGHAPVRAAAQELERIHADLARVSGVEARLVWSDDPDLNAFATEVGGERIVVVQAGLLQRFEGARAAVAAVLGHELAHHHAGHLRAGRRKQEGVRVLGAILGAVVGARVGQRSGELAGALSGAAVGVGAGLLVLKFNRTQELEADRLALQWMLQAGYNPEGMLRLQQRLGELAGRGGGAAILGTHPTSARRARAARERIDALAAPSSLRAQPAAPLVDAAALARARASILDAALAEAAVGASVSTATTAAPPSASRADPAVSGVRIGESVRIGRGVYSGGRALGPDAGEAPASTEPEQD